MNTIGRINVEAQRWLEATALEKWALSHDGARRYGLVTTNMSEAFNSILNGSQRLPVTALVQLTFFRFNNYFVARREQGSHKLASDEQYAPYVDAKSKAHVVKAGSFEIILYDHNQGRFHYKSKSGRTHRLNLHDHKGIYGKTLIYGFPCSHIKVACFSLYIFDHLFKVTTVLNRIMIHGQPCSFLSSMNMNDLLMMLQPLGG